MIRRELLILFIIIVSIFSQSEEAFAQEYRILLSANRFVVLDDPNSGARAVEFFDPADVRGGSWGSNYWNGESTIIRAAALIINENGSPQSGININFNLINPAGTVRNSSSSISDSKGMAFYAFDLNEQRYWGYWKVEANSLIAGMSVQNQSLFALNWWGCAQCHREKNPGKWGTRSIPNSYYTMGYDFHRSQNMKIHTEVMAKGDCIICHQMYNGTPLNWRFRNNKRQSGSDNEYPPDWHYGKVKCQGCHAGSNISTTPQGKNPEIAGCYDEKGCHPEKNDNLTSISTVGRAGGSGNRTNYSFLPGAARIHNSSTPCIICHGAGHNISKPLNILTTSNSFTEYQQCTSCHASYRLHNDSVSCTVCHSQDAHVIRVFAQNATFITGTSSPFRGNCTNCHQNSTFFIDLSSQSRAGEYIGKGSPLVPNPVIHMIGEKWKTQLDMCLYCHGNTLHAPGLKRN